MKYKNYNLLSTIIKTVDSFVSIASTSKSLRSSLTGFGLIILPISLGFACGLFLSSNILHEINGINVIDIKNNIRKNNKHFNFLRKYKEKVYKKN